MKERLNDFMHLTVNDAGRKKSALRIECSVNGPDCVGHQDLRLKNGNTRTQAMANKIFRSRHWFVATKRGGDICPVCFKNHEVSKRPQADIPTSHALVLYEAPDVHPEPAIEEQGVAMSSDDEFIVDYIRSNMIFSEDTGLWQYLPGQSDAAVFQDLVSSYTTLTLEKVRSLRWRKIGKTRIRRTREGVEVAKRSRQKALPPPTPVIPSESSESAVKLATLEQRFAELLEVVGTLTKHIETVEKSRVALKADMQAKIEQLQKTVALQDKLVLAMQKRVEDLSDDLDDFLAVEDDDA